ncbi:MAG: DUF3574 domain-containing protein [Hyphomicrobiaceae bacterium]|nr:DUF3574 domain-containing protein [Hyphomicrobiaceae bacterium]
MGKELDMRPIAVGLVAAAALAAVTVLQVQTVADACPAPTARRNVVELLLGRDIGGQAGSMPKLVSEADFEAFLNEVVTPRFPSGFSVIETSGRYRSPSTGVTVQEPGKLLVIALDGSSDLPKEWPADWVRVREVADAYKARFSQDSVGLIARTACVAF